MGTRNSKPLVPVTEVRQKINPQSKEYDNIRAHFLELSQGTDVSSARISKEIFIASYLKPRLPSFCADLLERFFIVLAYGGKDYIAFEEFVATKYLLEHSPAEAQQIIAKAADDFYTDADVLHEYRLRLIFNLLDLDFNGLISMKEYQKVVPFLMQDEVCRSMDEEEMKEYDEWFQQLTRFAFVQFDRSSTMSRITFREFHALARHDLTVKYIMDAITPQPDEFECLKYAQAIQRKHDKKRSKKDRKKRREQGGVPLSSTASASTSAMMSATSSPQQTVPKMGASDVGKSDKEHMLDEEKDSVALEVDAAQEDDDIDMIVTGTTTAGLVVEEEEEEEDAQPVVNGNSAAAVTDQVENEEEEMKMDTQTETETKGAPES